MTKWQLMMAFLVREPLCYIKSNKEIKHLAIVNAIEYEDGSGHSFNVTGFNLDGKKETIHIRTID